MPVGFKDPPEDPADLWQGDIFLETPSVHIRSLNYMVELARNEFGRRPKRPRNLNLEKPHPANAMEIRTHGILLTHECEIDKNREEASATLALVRSLDPIRSEEDKEGIRGYTRHRAFYLPPNPYLQGENYVDLRVVTTLRMGPLLDLKRIASLDEDGRRMLREHIFRFYSRRFLPDEWVSWPEDRAAHAP